MKREINGLFKKEHKFVAFVEGSLRLSFLHSEITRPTCPGQKEEKVAKLTQPPHPHHELLSSFWVILFLDPVRLFKRPQIRVLWRNRINRRIIYTRERF